ncbi:hypothetical protein [Spiroplasma endosymbiont of Virgichneumon dumeticola]
MNSFNFIVSSTSTCGEKSVFLFSNIIISFAILSFLILKSISALVS